MENRAERSFCSDTIEAKCDGFMQYTTIWGTIFNISLSFGIGSKCVMHNIMKKNMWSYYVNLKEQKQNSLDIGHKQCKLSYLINITNPLMFN